MSQKNASDRAELERADQVLVRQADDMAFVMGDPRGRRFLWELLGTCGVYRLSYEHSGSATMFKEGERNIGLALLNRMIEVDPDLYLKAQAEAIELRRLDAERINRKPNDNE